MKDNLEKYKHILDLPHPVSRTHPQMSAAGRAAQFAPFAALTGFDQVIIAMQQQRCDRILLTEAELEPIHAVLTELKKGDMVSVSWFFPDPGPNGSGGIAEGRYREICGTVLRIDPVSQLLRVRANKNPVSRLEKDEDRVDILFDDILYIRVVDPSEDTPPC